MKIWAILRNTYREIVRQPIFYFLVCVFGALIFLSQYITLFAFGAEISMMKEMVIASIALCGLLLALFASTTVITEEIENKTVITVLSKPVYRNEFILGKFFGILYAIFLVILFFSLLFTLTLWMSKASSSFFTFRDYSKFVEKSWQDVSLNPQKLSMDEAALALKSTYLSQYLFKFFQEDLVAVYKGIFLTFIQIILLSSVSILASCVFSSVVNVAICFFVFILGHLWEYTVSLLVEFPLGAFFAKILSWFIPNLEYFNLSWAISVNKPIPFSYLVNVTCYGFLYTMIALMGAMFLFKDREVM